jgi:RNA polymerase sigma-70 factor, ECF subfamily
MRRSVEGAGLDEIEAVYRGRLAELRRVATAITGSREPALDAVQDAFALAVHRRAQFRGEGSLDAWLWRIVVNTARDVASRLNSARTVVAGDLFESSEEAEGPADAGMEEVQRLIRELPERQRLVLFLHYYADLDYATIADALEISGGTVGATLNQARESLRRLMAEVKS